MNSMKNSLQQYKVHFISASPGVYIASFVTNYIVRNVNVNITTGVELHVIGIAEQPNY